MKKLDVVLGLQWGDEGKGKVVDVLTPGYKVIARFQGGPNAGHSLKFGGDGFVLHTVPSGIFREDSMNIIGNGVVIDPVILMDEIRSIEEKNPVPVFAVTTGRTFLSISNPLADQQVSILSEEGRIIQDMAEKSDCVIVGRRADYILRDKKPLRLFIYAGMDFKMQRCREWEHFGEEITDKALRQKIQSVDKERAKYYEFMTGQKWGDKANYDICLNTSALGIEKTVQSILALLK